MGEPRMPGLGLVRGDLQRNGHETLPIAFKVRSEECLDLFCIGHGCSRLSVSLSALLLHHETYSDPAGQASQPDR